MVQGQKKKVKDLKEAIKLKQTEILEIIKSYDPVADKDKPSEEQEKNRKDHQVKIEIEKTNLENLKTELKLTRMNKNGSSFFEFIPTPPNRRFRKLTRKFRLV